MLRLKDRSALTDHPSPPGGIELPPLHEPQWLEATASSYVSSSGVTIMTATELAEAGVAATPPAPRIDMFGTRISHITDHFVLGASKDVYRIFPFQSSEVVAEFPVTAAGWGDAWAAFIGLEAA